MPDRLACPLCEVLSTDDLNVPCWSCGGVMVLATQFLNPAASPFRNPILALIAQESP